MTQGKNFYVYVHKYASGPKEGQVFYVGKGSGKRAWHHWGRSEWWDRVNNKYGFYPEIVIEFRYEECAFSIERSLIALYGRDKLVNLTDGGEGPSGLLFCRDTMKPRHGKNSFCYGKCGELHPMFGTKGALNPMYGKKHTKETIEKMSGENNHMFGRKGSSHHLFGKSHSEETIEALRSKSIDNGISKSLITNCGMFFNSGKEAERWLKKNGYPKAAQQNISSCANGKSKSAYGYTWSFVK